MVVHVIVENKDMVADIKEKWDYLGCMGRGIEVDTYMSNAWCQTLLTVVNRVSSLIHIASRESGANTISINPYLLPIFEAMLHFDMSNSVLAGKYKVYLDNTLPLDKVYVYISKADGVVPVNGTPIEEKGAGYYYNYHNQNKDVNPVGEITVVNYTGVMSYDITSSGTTSLDTFEIDSEKTPWYEKIINWFKFK